MAGVVFTLAPPGGGLLMDAILGWGRNDDGQLGDGTRMTPPWPILGPSLPEAGVKQLAAGVRHSLALLNDGTVWAWGSGWGILGNNTLNFSLTPVQVAGENGKGWLTDVEEIAAGAWHCLARKSDGTLWAWGDGIRGQLGIGKRDCVLAPVQVAGLPKDEIVTAIAAGKLFSLAVTMRGNVTTVWAWGQNDYGQLGRPPAANDDISALPVPVIDSKAAPIKPYLAVAAGGEHGLALRGDGVVEAWGANGFGQLGDGMKKHRALPREVRGLPQGQDAILQIAAHGDFSLALASGIYADQDAGVWAWGYNLNGELGDGTTVNRPRPVRVVGPGGEGYLTNISAIAAGDYHSLALRENDHTVWAWGNNAFGQLGSIGVGMQPVQAACPNAIKHIAAGYMHSLASRPMP
jgi:alpha-tubulin suppressor-like RCC1 family protein